ncbi:MAG: YicC family protein [Acidobacteria bacterium]|nr:YicC family protein [Acidobacteriota bacterium]MYH29316.1 YicC family protein [Acidobacteriota bacterium]MYK90012.1 YicC family protein [Acidobacteriota bacterium]
MIKSMTGFASLTREDEALTVSVTARSVNHRYLDLQVHLPPSLLRLEPRVRDEAQRRLARGRVEIRVAARRRGRPPVEVEVDEALIAALVDVAARPDVQRATGGRWTVGELLGFPQVVTVAERTAELGDDPDVETAVTGAVGEALGDLDRMRTSEGGHLRADLDGRLLALGGLIERIEQDAGAGAEALGQRLTARLAEIGPDVHADQAALAQEVVRFVARSDIHEEITRLRAHVSHWGALADAPEPCGRKLDFLLQEMNREVNTIGSKADGHETSGLVVAAKAELEKLREQAQNVE